MQFIATCTEWIASSFACRRFHFCCIIYVLFTSHFSPRFLHLVKQSSIVFLKNPLIFYYFMANGAINFTTKCFQEFLYQKFPLHGFTDNRRSSGFSSSLIFFVSFFFKKFTIGLRLHIGDRCFKFTAIASVLGTGWYVLTRNCMARSFENTCKENSFFRLFPFCKLNVSSGILSI